MLSRLLAASVLLALVLALPGCVSAPPKQPNQLCAIFEEKPGWHRAAHRMYKKWGIPVPVAMAFVHRESSYRARAKPPRTKVLWVIPWRRPSSAYGYAQATDPAWREYLEDEGGWLSDRDDFSDAMDFIGWYNHRSHKRLGITKGDAYRLYVAYYVGPGGYQRGRWRRDATVQRYAGIVSDRASRYSAQYQRCPKPPSRFGLF